MRFLTIKKKSILILLIISIIVVTFSATYFSVKTVSTPKYVHSIIIDAGHGGHDVKQE